MSYHVRHFNLFWQFWGAYLRKKLIFTQFIYVLYFRKSQCIKKCAVYIAERNLFELVYKTPENKVIQ